MQKLRIPLHEKAQTTRKTRVVWHVLPLLILIFGAWFTAELYLERTETLTTMPSDTILALHFAPFTNEWNMLEREIGSLPLISDRPFFVQDLIKAKVSEFTLYLQRNGTWSLSVRTKRQPDLEKIGIVTKKVGKYVYLLSETITSAEKKDLSIFHPRLTLRRMFGISQGLAIFFDIPTPAVGLVRVNRSHFEISVQHKMFSGLSALPDENSSFFAVLSPDESEVNPFLEHFQTLLGSAAFPTIQKVTEAMTSRNGSISLKLEQIPGSFRIQGTFPDKADGQTTLKSALALWSAYRNPTTAILELPDRTTTKELRADPSDVTVESIVVNGKPILKTTDKNGSSIYGIQDGDSFVITDEEEETAQNWEQQEDKDGFCIPGPISLFLDLHVLRDKARSMSVIPNSWETLANIYGKLAIKSSTNQTILRFCK